MSATSRILLLEDVATDAELAMRELKRSGTSLEMRVVSDRIGLERELREFLPHLLLSDYSLPALTGAEALAIARGIDPDLPVIILSGTIGDEAAIEVMKAGATDYVLKDRLGRLVPAVRRALDEREQRVLRRQAERELREKEELHRIVVEALGEGVLVYTDGRIVSCNASAERITGIPAERIVGSSFLDPPWKLIDEDSTPLAPRESPAGRSLANGQPIANEVVGLCRADDSVAWLSMASQPVLADDGRSLRAVVVSFTDITQRRMLEAQLRHAQKLESIGRMAAGIAHDFNNMLTAITGYGDLVLQELPTDHGLRPDIEEIQRAAERATQLTRQLLAFGREQALRPRVIQLEEVVRGIAPMLRRVVPRNVDVSIAAVGSATRVRADPGQIEQVLLNLAVNAADAMPQGGRFRIETSVVQLDDAAVGRCPGLRPGPHARIVASDTGLGMDARTLARAFEPFFTTKAVGQGTGLGLATVHGIVGQSGGHVGVVSEPGCGTTFEIHLPQVEDAITAVEAAPIVAGSLRGTETILVALGEDQLQPLTRRMLESHGYRVLSTSGGADALRAFEHPGGIDLLIAELPVTTPGGVELEKAMQERGCLRVLFLSGRAGQVVPDPHALGQGRAVLARPFGALALLGKVRELLDARTVTS